MTDTNGLLRDAGGARPRDELDGLIERLRSVSCILTPECDEHKTVREAAAALVQLREENARLLSDPMNVGWQRAQDAIKDRAAAVSQWKAAIEWQDCALVMQTERDALKQDAERWRKAEEIFKDMGWKERIIVCKVCDDDKCQEWHRVPTITKAIDAAMDAAKEK